MSAGGRTGQATTSDPGALVKGASRGFTVLLLGGAVQPLVGLAAPPLGYVWLPLVAVVAFALAARAACAPTANPPTYGVAAALGGYLLVLPLVLMGTGGVDPLQLLLTGGTAVLVGGVVGLCCGRVAASGGSGPR